MPNRILREGIITSRTVSELSDDATILYYRLLSVVDDYGRCEADLDLLRAKCFPLQLSRWTTGRIGGSLLELGGSPLVTVYHREDKKYLQVNNFGQRVQSKEKYPGPDSPGVTVNHGGSPLHARATTPNTTSPPSTPSTSDSSLSAAEVDESAGEDGALVPVKALCESDDSAWHRFMSVFLAAGKKLNERDVEKALRQWLALAGADRLLALGSIEALALERTAEFLPLPVNHLIDKPWTRRGPERMIPDPVRLNDKHEQAKQIFLAGQRAKGRA